MNARRMLAAGALCALGMPAFAADHAEAPGTQADPAADISDYYAWYSDGTVKAILTFNALMVPGDAAVYDPDVLYTLNFDVDGDDVADHMVHVRFGQAADGSWGVQASNLPGAGAPQHGPVEMVVSTPGGKLFAGLRDDPFFFDLTGYSETLSTGTLSFDNTRDDFAGTNAMAIVVEFDAPSLLGSSTTFQTWATTSRI